MAVGWIDRSERTAAVSRVQTLRRRVVPHVVRIVAERDGFAEVVITTVNELQPFALPIRDGDDFRVGGKRNSLRLAESRQAL